MLFTQILKKYGINVQLSIYFSSKKTLNDNYEAATTPLYRRSTQ